MAHASPLRRRLGRSSPTPREALHRAVVESDDLRRVLIAQGGYYLATGVAPFVSRAAFEAVTGPKREWWLVQTVAGMVTAIGAALTSAALRDAASPELVAIAAGSAATLAGIDVVYVARGRI